MFKTTIVIWSEDDPRLYEHELEGLAREATSGAMYCSKQETVEVKIPETDPDWDGTDFFDEMHEMLGGPAEPEDSDVDTDRQHQR
jgi:hypothetical protein